MSPDQRKMCFAEWRKCWSAIISLRAGSFPADEKVCRVAITRKAIDKEKSWGDTWTQKEVDWLLAIVWAISQGENLELQLRQVDQPLTRAEGSVFAQTYLDAICAAAVDVGDQELVQRLSSGSGRESYITGICRRIHKCELADINDAQWRDVLSALNHTRLHKERREHTHSPQKDRPGAAPGQRRASHVPASSQKTRPAELPF